MRWRGAGADGFTLIEALVAFVVLALLTIALQRAVIGTVDAGLRARDRLDAGLVARTLLESETLARAGEGTAGRLNGHDWRLRFEDVALSAGAAGQTGERVFRPQRMVVEVALARGGTLRAERLRTLPFGGQGAP